MNSIMDMCKYYRNMVEWFLELQSYAQLLFICKLLCNKVVWSIWFDDLLGFYQCYVQCWNVCVLTLGTVFFTTRSVQFTFVLAKNLLPCCVCYKKPSLKHWCFCATCWPSHYYEGYIAWLSNVMTVCALACYSVWEWSAHVTAGEMPYM